MRIKGRKDFIKRLKRIPDAVVKETEKAIQQGAEEMTDVMLRFVPVDNSGDLKKSIGYTMGEWKPDNANVRGFALVGGAKKGPQATIYAGSKDAFYAAFVEFGTAGGQTPRPFFFPAYRLTKRRVRGRITRAMNKAAKKHFEAK